MGIVRRRLDWKKAWWPRSGRRCKTGNRSWNWVNVGPFDTDVAKLRTAPANRKPLRARRAVVNGKHILGDRMGRPDQPDLKRVNPMRLGHLPDECMESTVCVAL